MLPLSSPHNAFASVTACVKAALTSPLVLVCTEQVVERWVYSCIYEAVELSVIRPDNAEMQGRDAVDKDRTVGFRRQSPPLVRNAINRLLTALGWGMPLDVSQLDHNQSTESEQTLETTSDQSLDVGGTRVTNLSPLEVPTAHGQDQTTPIDATDDSFRPTTPPTPIASMHDQGDNDPRIRITSREGIVEMEVRLPPRILSTHTELDDELASSPDHRATASQNSEHSTSTRTYHRITQLSSEPAQMISAIVTEHLVGVAMLPIKLIVLRLIAAHYVARHGGLVRNIMPLPSLSDMTWRSFGIQMSRLALCSTMEIAIDLSLWGLQYAAITRVGQTVFGWGGL